MAQSIQFAAAQLHLFSMADYHIITPNSGFGLLGAWLSNSWHNIYSVSSKTERSCGQFDYDRLDLLAVHWAGV